MNYQKLDAALAMALNEVESVDECSLVVFIHTDPVPDRNAIALLEQLGVSNVKSGGDVFTATLSTNGVAQLSQQSWVQYLKLSHKLRLLNN
ncbi:MAG: hypothetical protein WBG73_14610 [Coleofasciculaceae cyanobacterium]